MKLSQIESSLLPLLQFSPLATIEELTANLQRLGVKVKAHAVQYALKRLYENEVIHPSILINSQLLGLQGWELYVTLAGGTKGARMQLLSALAAHPQVHWYAALAGAFVTGCSFYANSHKHAADIVTSLMKSSDYTVATKTIAAVISITFFEKSYLAPSVDRARSRRYVSVGTQDTTEVVTLDSLDKRLLSYLKQDVTTSRPQLARMLGAPRATVEHRIERLMTRGVVIAPFTFINAGKLGLQTCKLLLTATAPGADLTDRLHKFCLAHQAVTLFLVTLGAWDYEIVLEYAKNAEVTTFRDELSDAFVDQIAEAHVVTILSQGVTKMVK